MLPGAVNHESQSAQPAGLRVSSGAGRVYLSRPRRFFHLSRVCKTPGQCSLDISNEGMTSSATCVHCVWKVSIAHGLGKPSLCSVISFLPLLCDMFLPLKRFTALCHRMRKPQSFRVKYESHSPAWFVPALTPHFCVSTARTAKTTAGSFKQTRELVFTFDMQSVVALSVYR